MVGNGCFGGKVCLPKPGPNFADALCIFKDGDADCPSDGPYKSKSLLHLGIDDSRSCSACTCGAPVGMICSGTSTLYGDGACAQAVGSVTQDGSCTSLGEGLAAATVMYVPSGGGPSNGACAANVSNAFGNAKVKDPVTVCCAG